MPAGTIALNYNSNNVSGSGTSFTKEIKAGDFIGVTVGGAPYTIVVLSINSDTQLTMSVPFNGPSSSGLAWYAVPASFIHAIPQQALNDMGRIARGMLLEKSNWQGIYSDAPSVTVTRPDMSTYTGPSWGYLSSQLANKADKNDSRISGALQTTGGTMAGQITSKFKNGASFYANYDAATTSGVNTFNNVLQGGMNASQYMQLDLWNDSLNVFTRIVTWNTNPKVFRFVDNGNGVCDGQWISGSDERHKTNITIVPDALSAVMSWRGCTYDKKDGIAEVGLIAQDVEKCCPVAIMNTGHREYSDGTVIDDFKSLNTAGVSAAYHTEAIKSLFSLVKLAITDPATAMKEIARIEGLKDESAS